jgi:hypothetical protein
MKHEGSLSYSRVSANRFLHEPAESSSYLHTEIYKIDFNTVLISTPKSPKWTNPSMFAYQYFVGLSHLHMSRQSSLIWIAIDEYK